MTFPVALPDWLPWWVPILVLVPALLYVLAFLFMPFAVFGVKGRLEAIEARLDEIQGEIRSLALRMPEPISHSHYDDAIYAPPEPNAPPRFRADPTLARPPIPPALHHLDETGALRASRRGEAGRTEPIRPGTGRDARGGRAEPRLD